jgi:hypothetical protein
VILVAMQRALFGVKSLILPLEVAVLDDYRSGRSETGTSRRWTRTGTPARRPALRRLRLLRRFPGWLPREV